MKFFCPLAIYKLYIKIFRLIKFYEFSQYLGQSVVDYEFFGYGVRFTVDITVRNLVTH